MASVSDGLGRFVWHDLVTGDVRAAVEFYSGLMPEWTIRACRQTRETPYHMIEMAGQAIGGIGQLPPKTKLPAHWIGYVAVEDCDAAVAKAKVLGGECLAPPMDMPGAGRFATLADVEGAAFKVYQPAEPVALPALPGSSHFCWDELLATDLPTALDFYRGLFGWGTADAPMGERRYVLFKIQGKDTGGAMERPDCCPAPCWSIYLAVDDLTARVARAESLGGKTWMPPTKIPGVGSFSVHGDPTGGVISLFQGMR